MLAANMENTTMRMRIETSLAVKMTIDFHAHPVPDAFPKVAADAWHRRDRIHSGNGLIELIKES